MSDPPRLGLSSGLPPTPLASRLTNDDQIGLVSVDHDAQAARLRQHLSKGLGLRGWHVFALHGVPERREPTRAHAGVDAPEGCAPRLSSDSELILDESLDSHGPCRADGVRSDRLPIVRRDLHTTGGQAASQGEEVAPSDDSRVYPSLLRLFMRANPRRCISTTTRLPSLATVWPYQHAAQRRSSAPTRVPEGLPSSYVVLLAVTPVRSVWAQPTR